MPKVTVGVPTRNRLDTLALTLEAIALQTHKDIHVIVGDDSDPPVDPRTLPAYRAVFELFNAYGITFEWFYGNKLGQHHLHQHIQDIAKTDWIWRCDDDCIPEPGCLEILLKTAVSHDKVGAVGGMVLHPNSPQAPENVKSVISNPFDNVQWFRHSTVKTLEVEHLYSTFLYRRGVSKFNLFLSPAAHREETLFTHDIFRQGYKLLVDTGAVTWHFPAQQGGIRSHQQHPEYWKNDEKIFNEKLQEWGVNCEPVKYIVLDCGRGDHVLMRSLLPRLKAKYKKLVFATCFRDIFDDQDVEQISIAQAHQMLGPLERFNIYYWCIANNWKGNLVDAFASMYDLST
jgi:hypothetical protein